MMICFDITKRKTYDSVRRWLLAVQNNCEEKTVVLLVGTKCDLADDRQVSQDEANQFAAENNILYFETSARENIKVNDVFEEIIDLVYQAKFEDDEDGKEEDEPVRDTIKIGGAAHKDNSNQNGNNQPKGKKGGCC